MRSLFWRLNLIWQQQHLFGMESNTHIRETKGHSRVIPTFFQRFSNVFPTFFRLVKSWSFAHLVCSKALTWRSCCRQNTLHPFSCRGCLTGIVSLRLQVGVTKLRTLYAAAHYRISSLTLPHKSIKVAWMTAHLANGVIEDLLLLICLSKALR